MLCFHAVRVIPLDSAVLPILASILCEMIIVWGILAAGGVVWLAGCIYAVGYSYAQNMLNNAEMVKTDYPYLSRISRLLGMFYMAVCKIFIASCVFSAFTLAFFLVIGD